MSHRKLPITQQRRAERRKQAEARQAEYDQLSTQQKLDRLPANGAKRQRARLEASLNKSPQKVVATVPETVKSNNTKKEER